MSWFEKYIYNERFGLDPPNLFILSLVWNIQISKMIQTSKVGGLETMHKFSMHVVMVMEFNSSIVASF